MTALSASRNTPFKAGATRLALVAGANVYLGGLAAINSAGDAVPASADTTLTVVGVFDRDGVGGDSVEAVREIAAFSNSTAGDALSQLDIGQICYAVDDATVAKTNGGGTRPAAGRVYDVDEYGVWVDFRPAATARKAYVQATVDTLVGTNVYRAVAPVPGRVTKIWSITEGVLTTGDATLTAKIGATAITGGVLTITQAGSAAGDVDSATPSAANACNAGDGLSVTVGGSNATATKARVTFEITY